MQHRFAGTAVHVQLYALGYVETSMTRGRRLLFPVPPRITGRGRDHT